VRSKMDLHRSSVSELVISKTRYAIARFIFSTATVKISSG
jgi:hypothetical protein